MSDEERQYAGASAAPAKAAESAPSQTDDNLLGIGDLVFGMREDGTFDDEADVRFPVNPHAQSGSEGEATAVFRGPGKSAISVYNNQRFGLKGNRANEWKAAERIIDERFKDFEGVRMSDALRQKYGTWKGFLLKCVGARDFAKNIASSYVDHVKARMGGRTADADDD